MKRLIPILVLVFLLASCTPASTPTILPRTPTATVTFSPTPFPTATEAPTLPPTLAPTEMPTAIPFESGPSLEFSANLPPPAWHQEFYGTVEGLPPIPIIIGLADGVVHDKTPPLTPISGVWMTPDGANAVADAWIRVNYYHWHNVMGNPGTYEEYLNILNGPNGGEVLIMAFDENGVLKETWMNPLKGFSLLVTDNIDSGLAVKIGPSENVFFSVDPTGRLLAASTHFSRIQYGTDHVINGVSVTNYEFIYSNFTSIFTFASLDKKCMVPGSSCGMAVAPPENAGWWSELTDLENQFMGGQKPLGFGLVRP